jgi:tetratricopeptide (TPR) repeat protein
METGGREAGEAGGGPAILPPFTAPVLLCTRPTEPVTTSPGQTGKGFKWTVTILTVLALIVLGFTARSWVPWLLGVAHTKKETIDSLNTLLDLVAKLVCWPLAGIILVVKLWREKKGAAERLPPSTAQSGQAGRDMISAGRDVQTGGQKVEQAGAGNAAAQGGFRVGGDFIQQKNEYRTEIHTAATSLPPSLHQLPPPPEDFKGRKRELDELRAAMKSATTAGRAVIFGLQGQGGVGKTTLALKLAQELSESYPDGQIYLDLKGTSEKPVPVSEAFAHVIRAFQPEAKLPESETELEALYRSLLHGKRVLLLMDNARDAAQVKPLVPPQGCAFLVTSRQHFTLPGLFAKDLEILPPGDAEALLVAIAPRIGGHAKAISKLCGFLPQALRLAGSALANRKDLSPEDYVRQLGEEKNRLQLLKGGDESVEASIGLSYALLDKQTQKQWRVLGVFPDTFDAAAAAAVWEAEAGSVQDILGVLMQYSMLEWNEISARYGLHDLMRDFARARLDSTELDDAGRRHSAHYMRVLEIADALYGRGGGAVKRALAMFDAEWGNVQAGQAWAADHAATSGEAMRFCCDYPRGGVFLLDLRQHPCERIRWRELALDAARRLKDRSAEGAHLCSLGVSHQALGKYRRAIEYQEVYLAIAREIGDRRGEGNAVGNLGNAYYSLGEYRRAIEYHDQNLAIDREIGNRQSEGGTLGNLGNAYYSLGEYRRAMDFQEKRLTIAREIGDRRGEGQALCNLGNAYYSLGEYRCAVEYYDQCLSILREIGDRQGEGSALGNLGVAYMCIGEKRRAIECYDQSLAITREIGDRKAEGNALCNLGNAFGYLGEYRRAIGYYEEYLAIGREIGDREGEGAALWNTSLALEQLGERKEAIERARAALQIYEEIESPGAEKVRKQLEEWEGGDK